MKITTLLSALSLALFFISCKETEVADDGRPRITAISIAGIPTENIEFDPAQQKIKIRLPALLPADGLVPSFETTENTRITEGLTPTGKLDMTPFCRCNFGEINTVEGQIFLARTFSTPGDTTRSSYRVTLYAPDDCLQPNEAEPITYEEMNSEYKFIRISLPVKNLYQNPYIYQYMVTNLETGQGSGVSTAAAGFCLNSCDDKLPNRLTFPLNAGNMPPGKYRVSLRIKCDTNLVVFSQPLVYK